MTPLKAIRLHCLDCCCGSSFEVANCAAVKCVLYQYRKGHNPARKRNGTDNADFTAETPAQQQADE